jgi:hypothetical protein
MYHRDKVDLENLCANGPRFTSYDEDLYNTADHDDLCFSASGYSKSRKKKNKAKSKHKRTNQWVEYCKKLAKSDKRFRTPSGAINFRACKSHGGYKKKY